ncbi:hypothetical protein PVMG_04563 [Plasmodium vivax Mauritania I]|uniref:Variable surface protein Vir7-like protein n=1 Tax=Plasmodium vivax Mauritania I TaxID=1035515 RepID=A0A0J9VQT8_PLAVI|nr:hypothetical protein PVMG_04563 [Plasmodium vivax Mauritania I]
MYDEFESPVERDPKINNYISLCHGFITVLKESKEQYNDFCMKLARNLGLYSEDRKITNPSHDRCNILYNWIYNSIKKYHIPDNIIKECFDEYDRIKKATGNIKCYYYTYNNTYEEPENILLLNIFKSYFETIKDIMNGDIDNYISSGHKYICEFVNIYNKMNSNYCLGKGPNGQKQQNTCGYLSTFKNNYNIFLLNQLKNKDKIISLDDDNSVYMNKCKSDKQKTVLPAEVHNEHPQFPHSRGGTRENLDIFSYQPTVGNYDTNTSISSTVSTAVGTVAGASSILALLYKVTQNYI